MIGKKIYIYTRDKDTPGIQVIVRHLIKSFTERGVEITLTHTCDNNDAMYIPYGPLETYQLIKAGRKILFSLMVDYYSIGCKNSTLFLLKEGKVFTRSFLKNIARYLLYYFREKKIFSTPIPFMFVSQNDIDCLKRRFPNVKCLCVPNGVNTPHGDMTKYKSDEVRLGMLSNWVPESLEEARWFIENYLPSIVKEIPNVKLYVAGKCNNQKIVSYFKSNPNIKYLGWIDSLEEYFKGIDIYVATVPRGNGILNKVLDAFAHQTPCIGNKGSFNGFKGLKNGCIECSSKEDYINAIRILTEDEDKRKSIVNNALVYIKEHNNWDVNYNNFINEIQKDEKI